MGVVERSLGKKGEDRHDHELEHEGGGISVMCLRGRNLAEEIMIRELDKRIMEMWVREIELTM